MSRQVRQRVTAVLVGGLVLGLPLLTNGMANAGEPAPSAGARAHPVQVIATASTSSSAGEPPSTRETGARRVPTPDLASPTDPASAAPAGPGPDVATQQVKRAESMSENGGIGLLAAVSMVLVVGVSAGVIRAIVSERASRTKIA